MDNATEFDVFISYSSLDEKTAEIIQEMLQKENLTCFLSGTIILGGEVYSKKIADAIISCGCMVIIYTSSSNQSEYVKSEISYALKYHIPIIPVLIDGFEFGIGEDFQIEMFNYLKVSSTPTSEQKYTIVEAVRNALSLPKKTLPPELPAPRPKWAKFILLGLLIIAVITSAYFLFFSGRGQNDLAAVSPAISDTAQQQTPTPEPGQTAESLIGLAGSTLDESPAAQPGTDEPETASDFPPIRAFDLYFDYHSLENGAEIFQTDDYQVTYREYTFEQTYGDESENTTKPLIQIYLPDDERPDVWEQYAAIDLDSSYMRLVDSNKTAWGASLILLPTFWTDDGILHQGGELSVFFTQDKEALYVHFIGNVTGAGGDPLVSARGYVKIQKEENGLVAAVNQELTPCGLLAGEIALSADRKDEAFQFIKISTMSCTNGLSGVVQQDSNGVVVNGEEYALPYENENGFAIPLGIFSNAFTVTGSGEKWDSPTMPTPSYSVELLDPVRAQIAAWYTAAQNPNHDNVAIWAASADGGFADHWKYMITAYSLAKHE